MCVQRPSDPCGARKARTRMGDTTKHPTATAAINHGRLRSGCLVGFTKYTMLSAGDRQRCPFAADQLSKPTFSIRRLASLRFLAISSKVDAVDFNGPERSDERIGSDTGFHRVFVIGSRVNLLAPHPRHEYSRKPIAAALLGAFLAIAAPETFTCVPPPSNVGSTTLMASPHFC